MRWKSLLMGLLSTSTLMSVQAWAQTLNFTVNGTVKQSACTPNLSGMQLGLIGGGSNGDGSTVTLGKVTTDHINYYNYYADGSVPGGATQIYFKATGCTGTQANYMWIHFTANVDSDGRIITNAGSANPLRFEIRDDDINGQRIIVGGFAGSQPGTTPYQGTAAAFIGSNANPRSAQKNYVVRWYAGSHVVNAGVYSASVTANFKYY